MSRAAARAWQAHMETLPRWRDRMAVRCAMRASCVHRHDRGHRGLVRHGQPVEWLPGVGPLHARCAVPPPSGTLRGIAWQFDRMRPAQVRFQRTAERLVGSMRRMIETHALYAESARRPVRGLHPTGERVMLPEELLLHGAGPLLEWDGDRVRVGDDVYRPIDYSFAALAVVAEPLKPGPGTDR